ncbi:lyase family protein [Afifella sp. IM 167]|uniref:lyase family protein n=1 Tax=Afifella sp. IM 167 TaxID=2033586 RepID=UPI001CCFD7F6|nr:lyase family protein [Afifella sp. IM 167]
MSQSANGPKPHPDLVRSYALEWRHGAATFLPLLRYNKAHVVAATEAGIIPLQPAASLLGALGALAETGFDALPQDARLDGHQPNMEAELARRCGAENAGWVSIGRARQECEFVARQIACREEHLQLVDAVAELQETLLELALRETEAVMPYATWGQPAEPITLGYYFAALAEGLAADLKRLRCAHESLSRSRADIGQVVPAPLPIDRGRVAELLGFPSLMRSSLYGYASLDAELEVLSAMSILTANLARAAENIFVWCSPEYGFLRFGDAFSGTSYLMPQKRNPYALRMVRPVAAQAAGAWSEALQLFSGGLPIVGNGLIHIPNRLMDCMKPARDVCTLLSRALPTLETDRERMRAAAEAGWAQAPQLVYLLVDAHGVPFRRAHHLVAEAVRAVSGQGGDNITPEAVAAALSAAAGGTIRVQTKAVHQALDVVQLVATRSNGGPAPASVQKQVAALREGAVALRQWLDGEHQRGRDAETALDAAARAIVARSTEAQSASSAHTRNLDTAP